MTFIYQATIMSQFILLVWFYNMLFIFFSSSTAAVAAAAVTRFFNSTSVDKFLYVYVYATDELHFECCEFYFSVEPFTSTTIHCLPFIQSVCMCIWVRTWNIKSISSCESDVNGKFNKS